MPSKGLIHKKEMTNARSNPLKTEEKQTTLCGKKKNGAGEPQDPQVKGKEKMTGSTNEARAGIAKGHLEKEIQEIFK